MFDKINNKCNAFTLAEVLVVLMIVGIIVAASMGVQKARTNYLNKFMYYSAYKNIKDGKGELISEGCTSATTTVCPTQGAAALPILGAGTGGFCERFSALFNSIGTVSCSTVTSYTDATNFADTVNVHSNFTTSNGMKFYNLSSAPITSGSNKYYSFYVDIDGTKRSSKLNEDIFKFILFTDGTFYPANNSGSTAITSTDYLTASTRYWDDTNKTYKWIVTGTSYQEAACKANEALVDGYIPGYCGSITTASACGTSCEVLIVKPSFMGF